ncbi:MAG: hypothetical protein JEY97_13530 [Bacteroidales bacterium]|nr:hypothetical protein [Bacteroidales bacterium]
MKELSILVTGIEYKIKKLINKNNQKEAEKTILKNENNNLNKIIDQQTKQIKELKEKFRNLKIAKSLNHNNGSVDAKNRINELVREIDRCIEFINN